jgi:hypothetical protein
MMHLFYLLYIYLRIINYKLLKTMVLIPAYMRFINYNLQYIQKFDCTIIVVNIIYFKWELISMYTIIIKVI